MSYENQKKQSLFEALKEWMPDSSTQNLRLWLKKERVLVDNKVQKRADTPILPGQMISFAEKQKSIGDNLKILFSDSTLVVVDKPAGLLSVASNTETKRTAHQYLKDHFKPKKVFVIHRLDQGTSGVLLFALNENVYHALKEQLANKQITREYQALVEGKVKENEGVWKNTLYEDKNFHVRVSKDPKRGMRAVTHFRVKNHFNFHTLLDFELETGKKNQIRVQSAHFGHPIAGDSKYGAKSNPIKRLALHAMRLKFTHPVTNKLMSFTSELPEAFGRYR